uniref:DUF7642 domain-containing protein n=2 Tax=Manihot esculenta TaxID=3983 RepID=A0A251LVW5_MANES
MLLGHAEGLSEPGSSKDYLLCDPEPEFDDGDDGFISEEILYTASFDELAIERRVPLSMVIDIIIEQGCLQSVYGIHTFRVESIASGKAAPVDELQVQGVVNPALLRKVIITEAAKNMQDVGKGCKSGTYAGEGESMSRTVSSSEGPTAFKSPTKSWKMTASPRYAFMEPRTAVPSEVVLNKLEELSKSVKKIESLIEKSQTAPESSQN